MLYRPRNNDKHWESDGAIYHYMPSPSLFTWVNKSAERWYWATNYQASFELYPPRYFNSWWQAAADCEEYNQLNDKQRTRADLERDFKELSQSLPPARAFKVAWRG